MPGRSCSLHLSPVCPMHLVLIVDFLLQSVCWYHPLQKRHVHPFKSMQIKATNMHVHTNSLFTIDFSCLTHNIITISLFMWKRCSENLNEAKLTDCANLKCIICTNLHQHHTYVLLYTVKKCCNCNNPMCLWNKSLDKSVLSLHSHT